MDIIHFNLDCSHYWFYLKQVGERVEIVFGLFMEALAELRCEHDKRREQVLIYLYHLFNPSIKEDSTNDSFEDIAKDLRRLKHLALPSIQEEVASERKLNELVRITLIHELLDLLGESPVIEHPSPVLLNSLLPELSDSHRTEWPVKQNVAMEAEQTEQLGEEIVLSEETLSIVCVDGLEVLLFNVGLRETLLQVVLIEDRVFDQVRVCQVVQDGIPQYLQFLILCRETMIFFERTVSEGL